MRCLEGAIEETYYHAKDGPDAEDGICPNLVKTETHNKGEVAYIRDEIALHVVRPQNGDGISSTCTRHRSRIA